MKGPDETNLRRKLVACVMLLLLQPPTTFARIGPDGRCGVKLFAPFTTSEGETLLGIRLDPNISVGFSNMAAAVLAAEHFNSRNATLVPQLANLTGCNCQIDVETVYNTHSDTHNASRLLMKDLVNNGTYDDEQSALSNLCALVGPYHDVPTQELGVMASAARLPLVVSRSFGFGNVNDGASPFTTSVYPDTLASAEMVITYLQFRKRDNFIALLYPLSQIGLQRRSALGVLLDALDVSWMSSEYVNDKVTGVQGDTILEVADVRLDARTIRAAVQRIKRAGYRTIIIAADDALHSYALIADAVEEFGMNNGEYFFVLYDTFEPSLLYSGNTNLLKMVHGAAYVIPLSLDFFGDNDIREGTSDILRGTWVEKGQDFADKVNALNPIHPDEEGYFLADADYFRNVLPDFGAAFAYDAIMSVGIGACLAQKEPDGSVSGSNHHRGIRSAQFAGASGWVRFGSETLGRGGARLVRDLVWTAVNMVNTSLGFQNPDFWTSKDEGWVNDVPYIYAGNTTTAPKLLRDEPDQNHLDRSVRIGGLSVMSFIMVVALYNAAWVFFHRKHRIVAASQPFFLYLICIGTIVQAATVLTLSFDEGTGNSQQSLSRLCMATPWTFCLGSVIVDCATFSKLWRVHKVLQFSRRKVNLTQVLWPMALLCTLSFVILALWTSLDPLEWERSEVNSITGESVGKCVSPGDHLALYIVPLLLVLILAGALMAYMAWKCKDVDQTYSESNWILILMLVQFEVVLVAAPIMIRLGSSDPNSRYLAFMGLVLSFPGTTLGFMFWPKKYSYYRSVRGLDDPNARKRGQHFDSPQVSGLTITPAGRSGTVGVIEDPSSTMPANQSLGTVREETSSDLVHDQQSSADLLAVVEDAEDAQSQARNAAESEP